MAADPRGRNNNSRQLFAWPPPMAQGHRLQQEDPQLLTVSADQDAEVVLETAMEGNDGDIECDSLVENRGSQQNSFPAQDTSFAVSLIEEVRRYPCLWNVTLQSHKDKPRKQEAWRRISAVMNIPENALIREFERLRDNYRRCIRKRETMTRSGSANKKLPTCDYFTELSFLRDVVTGRKTESNIQPVPLETADSSSCLSASVAPSDMQADAKHPQTAIGDTKAIRNARKRRSDQIDELLAVSLANDIQNAMSKEESSGGKVEDEDVLFCSSLVRTFQKLKGKKNKQAKMKVLEVLVEFETADYE